MPKTNKKPKTPKPRSGRPYIGVVRRCVSISAEDVATFISYGFGRLSMGVRRAAELVRKVKG